MTNVKMARYKFCVLMLSAIFMFVIFSYETVYAGTVNKENLVTNITNPSNGVIKCNFSVPAGERIDYSVTLTPDKKARSLETIKGSWKNKTKKTVQKTVTLKVNYLSSKYKITASYSKKQYGETITYSDVDPVTSALKTSAVTAKMAWDFSELGKGQKTWKYRYKYVPYKKGFKQYVQIFDKKGKQIKSYVNNVVPVTEISKLIKEMRTR